MLIIMKKTSKRENNGYVVFSMKYPRNGGEGREEGSVTTPTPLSTAGFCTDI
jgi:hypothetical protein